MTEHTAIRILVWIFPALAILWVPIVNWLGFAKWEPFRQIVFVTSNIWIFLLFLFNAGYLLHWAPGYILNDSWAALIILVSAWSISWYGAKSNSVTWIRFIAAITPLVLAVALGFFSWTVRMEGSDYLTPGQTKAELRYNSELH